MKRKVFSILFALMVALSLVVVAAPAPALAVSGHITTDTTWSTDQTITGDVTVDSGVTLTINSGVTVKFDSGTNLIIEGTLIAEGTSGNNIIFTSSAASPAARDWNRIQFNSGSTGSVKYCDIAYGTIPIYLNSVSGTAGSPAVTIENCNIHDSGDTGISLITSDYNIVRNNTLLLSPFNPIWVDSSSHNLIEGNVITGGTGSYPSGSGYGQCIGLVANFGDSSNNTVRNNTLSNMIIGIKLCSGYTYAVQNNLIESNTITGTNTAIRLRSDGALVSGNIIRNNTLSASTIGLYVWDNTPVSTIKVTHNDISSNAAGVKICAGVDATAFSVNHNSIHHNTAYGVRSFVTGVSIMHNDIHNNTNQGVWLMSTAYDIAIAHNNINLNGAEGLKVDGDSNSIHHNTITSNVGYGIHLTGTSNLNTVHHNTLSGNMSGNIGDIQDDGPDNNVFRNK